MSGPVWRLFEGETISCSQCLIESTRVFAEGQVRDGEFYPEHYLCQRCYPKQIQLVARSR